MTFFLGKDQISRIWGKIFVFGFLWTMLTAVNLAGQKYFIGVQCGSIAYHGDLSESLFSAPGNFSGGFFAGKQFNHVVSLSAGYTSGKITGNDHWSYAYARVQRNLNFTSYIHEADVQAHINLNAWLFPSLQKYNLTCQLSSGVSSFWFRPMTRYGNRWIDLHAVGTEGQFIPGFEKNRYSLQQFAIPWGFSLLYNWNNCMGTGVAFSHRLLFTDYLDDVSSVYIHEDEFIATNNPHGAYLNNRIGENSDRRIPVETGQQRGDNHRRDGFYSFTFFVQYILEK